MQALGVSYMMMYNKYISQFPVNLSIPVGLKKCPYVQTEVNTLAESNKYPNYCLLIKSHYKLSLLLTLIYCSHFSSHMDIQILVSISDFMSRLMSMFDAEVIMLIHYSS